MTNTTVRSRRLVGILLPLLLLLAVAGPAPAFNGFLQLQGIPGESLDSRHAGWIDVESFTQAIANNDTRPSFSELWLQKAQDKSSPELALRAANGKSIPRAVLELTEASDTRLRFYQITLSNCLVRTVQISGAAGLTRPSEAIGLDYQWISWSYTEFDATGRPRRDISSYWDLVRARGGVGVDAPFELTGTKQGSNIVVTWPGRAGTTYRILGSSVLTGPYTLVQSLIQPTNGPVRLTFPISSGNLFYRAETP